jgi:hypothetical protein
MHAEVHVSHPHLVPLADLPLRVVVPVGAPLLVTSDWTPAIRAGDRCYAYATGSVHLHQGLSFIPAWHLALDLRDRGSLHIDGLTVGAAMLARVHGLDASGGALWARAGAHDYTLRVNAPEGQAGLPGLDKFVRRFVAEPPARALSGHQGIKRLWVHVPTLASAQDARHALALALLAVPR